MNKELKLSDRFTLSADGKTLAFREKHQYGTEPEGEDIRTLDRQPAESWEPDTPPKPARGSLQEHPDHERTPRTPPASSDAEPDDLAGRAVRALPRLGCE